MLQHVYERAKTARRLEDVWVATDDRRIFDLVAGFGGRAVMTSPDHVCGTDRVAEAASRPEAAGIDVIVNVQGDQPLIAADALDRLVGAFDGDPDLGMATLYEPLTSEADLRDPNVVKVVADRRGDAIYFSRSAIPWSMTGGLDGHLKHVGVYAFRREYLFEFTRMERGRLEASESLEQLRVIESGHRIRLVASSGRSISVETPGDIERVESIISD
jgi:3-deoxy-manno-octulosonate cytidylyltransferase (CMP-KDO synthetase)